MSNRTPSSLQLLDRRRFLWQSGGGLGGVALASLLRDEGSLGAAQPAPGATVERVLHHPPRAKRVVQLFMAGAASHLDTFDYKPRLIKDHGSQWDPGEKVELFFKVVGKTMRSPWAFQRYGQCGKHLSEIVAPLGECVDDIAFIHNIVGKAGVHSTATLLQATGFQTPGFPGMGAWVSYGLGSLNENLPTFVVLPDRRGLRLERNQELGLRVPAGAAPGDDRVSWSRSPDRGFVSSQGQLRGAAKRPRRAAARQSAQPGARGGKARRLQAERTHPFL